MNYLIGTDKPRHYLQSVYNMERLFPELQPLARNLKYLRGMNNFSQKELSLRSGISLKTVRSVEQGHRDVTLNTLSCLANALNCSISELVKGVE